MKAEGEPVTPDESVVRLVWWQFLRPGQAVPVLPVALKPRVNETDGISVFRAACLTHPSDALAVMAPEKRGKYAVAVMPMADLLALGLSFRPARIGAVAGHGVIPELNIAAAEAGGDEWKATLIALAQIAARNLIPPADEPNV